MNNIDLPLKNNNQSIIKDLFIPHSGNNYKPHSLHPKRLFFYGASALVMKFIVVAVVLIFPISAWLTPDILSEQGDRIIVLTNEIRNNLGVDELKKSEILTRASYRKAEDMLLNQYFSHFGPDNKKLSNWLKEENYGFKVAGENLAMGFSGAEDVVNAWVKSPTHYANLIDKEFTEIGVGMVSGFYGGRDTTLVAQFFALPVASANVLEEKNSIKTEEVIKAGGGDVLAEKTGSAGIIPAPTLVFPYDKYLTNEEIISFNIFAPLAKVIEIYDNEKRIAFGKTAGDYSDFAVNLEEGIHRIKIKAIRDDNFRYSEERIITVDRTPPIVNQAKTLIMESEPMGEGEKYVKVISFLSADTAKAFVSFDNYNIELERDINSGAEENKWVGQLVVFSEKDAIPEPIILPALTAIDYAGNSSIIDIEWDNVKPFKPSLLTQYFFLKGSHVKYLEPLFDLSSIYYKILLGLVVLSLLINILLEIKKQHPHIIASALGLIGLIVLLIIV